jgi:hypothetical protein
MAAVTAISLNLPSTFAQAPIPGGDIPAKTSWGQFPTTPPANFSPMSTTPSAPLGTRVVVFQKQPGEEQTRETLPAINLPQASLPGQPMTPPQRFATQAPPMATQPVQTGTQPVQPVPTPKPGTAMQLDPEKVFRVDSNDSLDQRMINELYQEALNYYNEDVKKFPALDKPKIGDYKVPDSKISLTTVGYQPKTIHYPPVQARLEPGFVVHRRLMFEEVNAERYGWDLGLLSPVVSTAYFYKDLLLWPAHMASNWRERYSTNAGKQLPGTPVPYFLYPPELSITGLTVGSGAIVATSLLLLP